MRMDATIWSTGEKKYSVYDKFHIDNETNNYRLHVSGYSGNTDHDYWSHHNGSEFSTRDRDNDRNTNSCSHEWKGGHWYHGGCHHVNPTGLYKPTGADSMNLYWYTATPVKEMTLKIKRM